MHLTRPKSSKRRSRPVVNSFLCASASDRPPESPGSSFLSRPEMEMLEAGKKRMDEALHAHHRAPPQSLNKYNVLPPIERRQSKEGPLRSLNEMISTLDPPDDASSPPRAAAAGRRVEPSLLLAIRAPCGRRFEQHFALSDTLQAVIASAEAKYGVRYEDAFIETVAAPGRALTDLGMTLTQCGVLNRSVLRISQRNESAVQQEAD